MKLESGLRWPGRPHWDRPEEGAADLVTSLRAIKKGTDDQTHVEMVRFCCVCYTTV